MYTAVLHASTQKSKGSPAWYIIGRADSIIVRTPFFVQDNMDLIKLLETY